MSGETIARPHSATDIRINANRLWTSLGVMGAIAPGKKGGSNRLALTDDDKVARDLLSKWCEEMGYEVKIDSVGNMFARRAGTDDSLPPVLFGSHLDTQPFAGRYDGVLGVLAGLEVLRTLHDKGIRTRHPVELVNWTNEEGARFSPGLIGSAVFADLQTEENARASRDSSGMTFGAELDRIGYHGGIPARGGHPVRAYFELHIEQGPVLEAEGIPIGIVTHAQGVRWVDVTFTGVEGHAGTMPMTGRRDALIGAARMIDRVGDIAIGHAPHAVATVGDLSIMPGSRNVVPGAVTLAIDMRHPSTAVLDEMMFKLKTSATLIAAELELKLDIREVVAIPPLAFADEAVRAIRRAADALNLDQRDIVSGALHDACNMARIVPTGMIFCPCVDGISHNEAEAIRPEWAAAGADVLLQAVIEVAELAA
ncbi:MAG: Zn-dependent hydrolase [Bauldia sp.]